MIDNKKLLNFITAMKIVDRTIGRQYCFFLHIVDDFYSEHLSRLHVYQSEHLSRLHVYQSEHLSRLHVYQSEHLSRLHVYQSEHLSRLHVYLSYKTQTKTD
jgi:hypothetical protein